MVNCKKKVISQARCNAQLPASNLFLSLLPFFGFDDVERFVTFSLLCDFLTFPGIQNADIHPDVISTSTFV
jgi:hypothetical protein